MTKQFPSEDPQGEKINDEGAKNKPGRHARIQQAIAAIVKNLPRGTHLTAGEVFERAQAEGLDVSLSTIYRNLHRMKEGGNVTTVSGERGIRYEASDVGPDHDHLICLGCGLTIEFVDDLIRGFGKTVAQRKGFEHKSSRFDILGYCSDCRSKDDGYVMRQAIELLIGASESGEDALANIRYTADLLEGRKIAKAMPLVEGAISRLKASIENCEQSLLQLKKLGTTQI